MSLETDPEQSSQSVAEEPLADCHEAASTLEAVTISEAPDLMTSAEVIPTEATATAVVQEIDCDAEPDERSSVTPRYKPVPLYVQKALFERMEQGDTRAREQLVETYRPMAIRLALKYKESSEPIDDLVQVACLGLLKAIDRFDTSRGNAFSTYAIPTMIGELKRYFRDYTWGVRPPRVLQELSSKVAVTQDRLEQEYGRDCTLQDVLSVLDAPEEQVREAWEVLNNGSRHPQSLSARINRDIEEEGEVMEAICDPRAEEKYEQCILRTDIQRAMSGLPDPRLREIVAARFEEDLIQREIAERIGTSQMHVSRLLRVALQRMATPLLDTEAAT